MGVGIFRKIQIMNLKTMGLELSEIKKRISAPGKKQTINKAISHENRLRFHTEIALTQGDSTPACTNFLEWVKLLLPAEKYRAFNDLFNFPIPTNELVEQIYGELEKVFEGRNPYYDYQFTNPELINDWNEYQKKYQSNLWT